MHGSILEVTLHNQASEIPRAHEALDKFTAQYRSRGQDLALLHLAIEEHLTNVISYGYNPGQAGTIRVRFALDGAAVRVEVEDDARPFNPLEVPEVDTSVPLEDKPIGGLGVHLVRKSVDSLRYLRAQERNVLIMTKRLVERRAT